MTEQTTAPKPKPPRRRFRVLFWIGLALLIASAPFLWLLYWNYEFQQAVAAIGEVGGKVGIQREVPQWALRFKRWIPEKYLLYLAEPTVRVNLSNTEVDDSIVGKLHWFEDLKDLSLNNTFITDAGLEQLFPFERLEGLYLNGTKVTDAGLEFTIRLDSEPSSPAAAQRRSKW